MWQVYQFMSLLMQKIDIVYKRRGKNIDNYWLVLLVNHGGSFLKKICQVKITTKEKKQWKKKSNERIMHDNKIT